MKLVPVLVAVGVTVCLLSAVSPEEVTAQVAQVQEVIGTLR